MVDSAVTRMNQNQTRELRCSTMLQANLGRKLSSTDRNTCSYEFNVRSNRQVQEEATLIAATLLKKLGCTPDDKM